MTKAPDDDFPLANITWHFSHRLSTELSLHHLEQARLRTILLNILYVETFGTSPFDVRFKGNEPHVDHIYPRSPLSTKLNLASTSINDIGNFRLIGATDNIRKRAELPDAYFARLKKSGVPIDRHLLLPEYSNNPALLTFDVKTYEKFRDERRQAIFTILKNVIDLKPAPSNATAAQA